MMRAFGLNAEMDYFLDEWLKIAKMVINYCKSNRNNVNSNRNIFKIEQD